MVPDRTDHQGCAEVQLCAADGNITLICVAMTALMPRRAGPLITNSPPSFQNQRFSAAGFFAVSLSFCQHDVALSHFGV